MKCRACGFIEEKVKEDSQRGFFQFVQEHPARSKRYDNSRKIFDIDEITNLSIYACPRCGTLRAKHYLIED